MPRGVYKRTKKRARPVSKKKLREALDRKTRAALADAGVLHSEIAPLRGKALRVAQAEDSEFLSHGSTHLREKANGYDRIYKSADIMASFLIGSHIDLPPTVMAAVRVVFQQKSKS
jgi:hypothetical protein